MEEKKNNKGLIWLIIILIVLVLGLIGFIVYDKVLKVDNTIPNYDSESTTTTSTTITNSQNDDKETIEKFTYYPKENDKDIIIFNLDSLLENDNLDLNTRFTNKQLNKYDITYNITCTEFDEEYTKYGYGCRAFDITLNDIKFKETIDEGCGHGEKIIIKDDILISQTWTGCDEGCGEIKIYKNSNLIYSIEHATVNGDNSFENEMKYFNNKLYYCVTTKDGYIALKTIDFSLSNIQEIEIERIPNRFLHCDDNPYDEIYN